MEGVRVKRRRCRCKVSGEATFSLDANRHVMNQRRRLAITNSLPVTENWTRVAQMAHFVANRCHTPLWLGFGGRRKGASTCSCHQSRRPCSGTLGGRILARLLQLLFRAELA